MGFGCFFKHNFLTEFGRSSCACHCDLIGGKLLLILSRLRNGICVTIYVGYCYLEISLFRADLCFGAGDFRHDFHLSAFHLFHGFGVACLFFHVEFHFIFFAFWFYIHN